LRAGDWRSEHQTVGVDRVSRVRRRSRGHRSHRGQPSKVPGTLPADDDPAWSPNGRQLAFDRLDNGNKDVWIMNTDGSGQRQLTFSRKNDDFPQWSPNGRWLAFQSAGHGHEGVYVLNLKTGTAYRVVQPGEFPDWVSNHRLIYDDQDELFTVDPWGDTSSPVRIGYGGLGARVANDGRTYVYDAIFGDSGGAGISLSRIGGVGVTSVTHDGGDDDPVLSPDARWVAFDSPRSDKRVSVYVIRADGNSHTLSRLSTGSDPDWR
jgi:Tol biopolymer transport system component